MAKPNHPLWSNFFRKPASREEQIAELWSQTPLFSGIPGRALKQLARNMPTRYYEAGESIFQVDDRGAGIALIQSGQVQVTAGDKVLAELGPGDFFGEVALVLDELRTANATATQATELAYFLRSDFQEWIEHSPRLGSIFAINLSRILAGRLRKANLLLSED